MYINYLICIFIDIDGNLTSENKGEIIKKAYIN